MKQTNEQPQEKQVELTIEELKAQSEELRVKFEARLPMLEAQLKYEELLTKIDEQRHVRWEKMAQKAYTENNISKALEEEAAQSAPIKQGTQIKKSK